MLLASGSPRRRELLGLFDLPFDRTSADIDETPHPGESAADYTVRLSREKAYAAYAVYTAQETDHRDALILAADTTVADEGAILGKPADAAEARAMLQRLRGRVHQVYTAITLLDTASGRAITDLAVTGVPMRVYTDTEIDAYIASGDPFDKAGGYAIQHPDFQPVNLRSGCFSNVVGLPLCHLLRALRDFGIDPPADIPARCQQHQGYDCDVSGDILAGQAGSG
ncbi:MAG: septum formation protein Maf [Anaerolineae bacterium]|nr:septum formation protein Maf [Anaerolineae bacterium]